MAAAFAVCLLTSAKAQGFLGLGAGINNTRACIVNIHGGYRFKYVVPEFEMKSPATSTLVKNPAIFCAKAGYPVNLGGQCTLLPQLLYSYQYHSADQSKGPGWQNGFKAGVGCRLNCGHLFIQADYLGQTYLSVGITGLLRNTRRN